MKHHLFILVTILFLYACTSKKEASVNVPSKALVTTTQVQNGSLQRSETIGVTTIFLQHNRVTAPIAGYLTNAKVKLGDRVTKGQLLYEIESKEKRALGNYSMIPSSKDNYGIIKIISPINGIIDSITFQQIGDFVSEGVTLCSLADPQSQYFILNIPYEYIQYINSNKICKVTLPNNQKITVQITEPLTQVTRGVQTIPYLAKPLNFSSYIPQNLTATAELITYKKNNTQLLPKEAVLSDELMQQFWIMKLINDSTAIKVLVNIGKSDGKDIEIISPQLNSADKILLTGNYGLSDTALVKAQ